MSSPSPTLPSSRPSSEPTPAAIRLAVLYGGEEIDVQTHAGATLKVKVGLVPLRHLATFVDLYSNPAALADFVCHVGGKPVETGWADQLTDESTLAIFEKAKALNFTRAMTAIDQHFLASQELTAPIMAKLSALMQSLPAQLSSSAAAEKKS